MFRKQKRSGSGEDHGLQEVVEPSGDVQEESSEDTVRDGVEGIRAKLTPAEQQYANLEDSYREKLPKNWDELTYSQQLEWFAHRMLLDKREDIRQEQGNEAAREWGFMSDYQIERRRRREVQSKLNSWDEVPPTTGNFHRKYVDPNTLWTGNTKPEDETNG